MPTKTSLSYSRWNVQHSASWQQRWGAQHDKLLTVKLSRQHAMVDVQWQKSKKTRNVQSFGHRLQRKVPLFLEIPKFPYNTVQNKQTVALHTSRCKNHPLNLIISWFTNWLFRDGASVSTALKNTSHLISRGCCFHQLLWTLEIQVTVSCLSNAEAGHSKNHLRVFTQWVWPHPLAKLITLFRRQSQHSVFISVTFNT